METTERDTTVQRAHANGTRTGYAVQQPHNTQHAEEYIMTEQAEQTAASADMYGGSGASGGGGIAVQGVR